MIEPTRRLYHEDATRSRFEGRVLDCRPAGEGAFDVVLDATAFYATSGGQPSDIGTLGGARVLDVLDRDGVLVHRVDSPLEGVVPGEIDWPRRFDHMQQHTGQHILSQAFIQVAGAETVSFHLGTGKVTIDLPRGDLTDPEVAATEVLANRIVQEDREVRIHWTTREEVARFPLRKPPQVDGPIRIVEIADFDFSACGGTHVARSGQIGLIKVLRRERYKGGVRVEFLAGGRAVADYGWKHDLVRRTAERYSTEGRELEGALERLEAEGRDLRRKVRILEEERLDREAELLAAGAPAGEGFRVVAALRNGSGPEELKGLALRIRSRPGLVALLGGIVDDRVHLVFARSDDVPLDVAAALKRALSAVSGRGGGRPEMAQGSGEAAGAAAALESARRALESQDSGSGREVP